MVGTADSVLIREVSLFRVPFIERFHYTVLYYTLPISDPDSEEPMFKLELEGSGTKITGAQWGLFDERLITGHENGEVRLYDVRSLKSPVKRTTPHKDYINDLQVNKDKTMFITASRDNTAKVCWVGAATMVG